MCGRSVASRRIVHVGSALGCCSVASALGPDRTFHCASAEAGRIGAIRRSTDHEEENFRAARTIRTLPPLFASVLHERDLRSFQRAAPLHLSVRVRLHDAGQHFRPRVRSSLNGSLTIIWRSAFTHTRKRCASLTIVTAIRAVGFHPKFWISCGDDVRTTLVPV